MIKKIFWALLIMLGIALGIVGILVSLYLGRTEYYPPDPDNGYHAGFYLYVPASASSRENSVSLLVQPNNSGTNSDDPEVHINDAKWMTFGRHFLADDLEVALLVPAFLRPSKDWRIYTHALDRDVLTTRRADLARLDLQLIAMIEHARAELAADGIETRPKILLQGYSASGMFANRFAAIHPERVLAVATGSPGGWPIAPIAQYEEQVLDYPAGIADLGRLTGRPFDANAYRQVRQLIVMGGDDDNDSLDFSDGWEPEAAAIVDELFGTTPLERWPAAEQLYANAGADAEFLLVPGVGHNRKQLQEHSTEFFRQVLANKDSETNRN